MPSEDIKSKDEGIKSSVSPAGETHIVIEDGGKRFQVDKVDDHELAEADFDEDVLGEEEEDDDDHDDPQFPLSTYGTRSSMSLMRYTREALPRLDNYRNTLSVHSRVSRPTLDELRHTDTIGSQYNKGEAQPPKKMPKQNKFGWIEGVLVRCLLNIWGVMIFVRLR